MGAITESTVESAALAWLEGSGWCVAYAPDSTADQTLAGLKDLG